MGGGQSLSSFEDVQDLLLRGNTEASIPGLGVLSRNAFFVTCSELLPPRSGKAILLGRNKRVSKNLVFNLCASPDAPTEQRGARTKRRLSSTWGWKRECYYPLLVLLISPVIITRRSRLAPRSKALFKWHIMVAFTLLLYDSTMTFAGNKVDIFAHRMNA